jgi:hypothetical protein
MQIRIRNIEKQMAKIVATQLLTVATQLLTVATQLLTGRQTERIYLWESWLPNADGTIESPSPEGNPLTQVTQHHIPLHLSLTGNLMSSRNYSSRSELWTRIQHSSRFGSGSGSNPIQSGSRVSTIKT